MPYLTKHAASILPPSTPGRSDGAFGLVRYAVQSGLTAVAKLLLLYGAGSDVVNGPRDNPVQGLIESQPQSLSILGYKVGEPFCLKQQL